MKATLKSYSFLMFLTAMSLQTSAAYQDPQVPEAQKVIGLNKVIKPVISNVINNVVTPLINEGAIALNTAISTIARNDMMGLISGSDQSAIVEKKKIVTKTYSVSSNDLITLDNRFGEIKIATWNKDEIKVEITITAKGSTDARAADILDRISIDEGKTSNGYRFRTDLDSKNERRNNNNTYKDEGFTINYDVMMPANVRLNVANEFGPTIIPDFSGQITISSKFGALTTGKLTNSKKVSVEFGSASIDGISNGDLDIKFSRAIISNMDGSLRAKFEHSSGVLLNIDNNLKGLAIQNDFTKLQLNVNRALSAKYNITTNFGDFNNKTEFDISDYADDDDDNGPRFKKRYTGKSGGGNIEFKVSAEFSDITIGHTLKMELKDEKKEKKGKGSVNI